MRRLPITLLVLTALCAAPRVALGAGERVTLIAEGRMALSYGVGEEVALYVASGCDGDRLEARYRAFLRIDGYRGKTLRVTALGAETRLEEAIGERGASTVDIEEVHECSLLGWRDRRRHGQADENHPREFVATGMYISLVSVDMEHLNVHFKVELIERD